MSHRARTSDPIRDPTVRSIANAVFAELFLLNKTEGRSWDDVLIWAEAILDEFLREKSRLPTIEEVNEHVRGVTGA